MWASATRSSQNRRASSRAASTAKRRSSAKQRRPVLAALVRAGIQHALDHAPLEPRRPTLLADQNARAHRRQRFAERRIGEIRQSGLAVERAETGNILVVDVAGDAVDRHAGQFRQRLLEQHDIAGQQCAQDHAGGELTALTQMLHQRADFVVRRVGGERDGRLFAGLSRRVFGVLGTEPLPRGDEAGERLRQLRRAAPDASPSADRRAPAGFRGSAQDDRTARQCDRSRTARCRRRNFPAA